MALLAAYSFSANAAEYSRDDGVCRLTQDVGEGFAMSVSQDRAGYQNDILTVEVTQPGKTPDNLLGKDLEKTFIGERDGASATVSPKFTKNGYTFSLREADYRRIFERIPDEAGVSGRLRTALATRSSFILIKRLDGSVLIGVNFPTAGHDYTLFRDCRLYLGVRPEVLGSD
ncbi:hypothetical protein GRI69_01090 [Erythrobacter vulgaris]|uniref:Uncharacterized protein n=1 Tax=Qipengyuania vulgaris TaxID=291985 RepID=A0A844XN39_9SPHN|nr:hypothetical protein [Qipengyuania vulgaris]MXO46856.1 hypothetical protein [Qipengyuania vulgaris]